MGSGATLKYVALILGNASLAALSYYAAFLIRFGGSIPDRNLDALLLLLPAILVFHGLTGFVTAGSSAFGRTARVHGLALLLTLSTAWVFRDHAGAFPTSAALLAYPLLIGSTWLLEAVSGFEKVSFGSVLLVASHERARQYRQRLGTDAVEVECISGDVDLDRIAREGRYRSIVSDHLPDELDRLLALLYSAEAGGSAIFTSPERTPESEWVICDALADRPLVQIRSWEAPLAEATLKRAFDILVAVIILPIALPAAAFFGRTLAKESPGPVLYRQRRLGWRSRPFEILKLRTMPVGVEDETGPVWASEDDERATSLGRILRRFGIDELPQVINVLRGEMSIVGPRPERDHFAADFHQLGGQRLLVKPGLTGLAQIQLRKDASVEEKVRYDTWYIKNRSLWIDLWIVFRTATKLWSRFGVEEARRTSVHPPL